MKVKDILNALVFSSKYRLIGAKTGKTLFQSWINKDNSKYLEMEYCSIEPSFKVSNCTIFKTPEFITPVINIYIPAM